MAQNKINYQVMTNEQMLDGKYYPDYDKLLQNATDVEEKNYIKDVQKRNFKFAYNMVYIAKQKCGHYEIFQTPCNEHYPLSSNLAIAKESSTHRMCTHCTCEIHYRNK